MNAQYTPSGEWVTPERVDAIREEGRREVLDVVRTALPATEADYIESRLRTVTTPVAMPGATPGVTGIRSGHAGRSTSGNPGIATAAVARAQPGLERVQRTG